MSRDMEFYEDKVQNWSINIEVQHEDKRQSNK